MKYFTWDEEKNSKLIKERKISFEEIIFYIENGQLLDVFDHPNQAKYRGQKMFVVNVNNYAYLVPFVETQKEVILKTIIPSRKATKTYLGG